MKVRFKIFANYKQKLWYYFLSKYCLKFDNSLLKINLAEAPSGKNPLVFMDLTAVSDFYEAVRVVPQFEI